VFALRHPPSCCRLRQFGRVGVSIYHSWRRSWRGRALTATPEEVAQDPSACQNRTSVWETRPYGRGPPAHPKGRSRTCQSAATPSKAQPTSVATPWVLGRVIDVSSRGNLPSLLERRSEHPMASALQWALHGQPWRWKRTLNGEE
ncbi:unnamed protein product, partial [Ascophyllum nodosum]